MDSPFLINNKIIFSLFGENPSRYGQSTYEHKQFSSEIPHDVKLTDMSEIFIVADKA